jgi:signal peptidase I
MRPIHIFLLLSAVALLAGLYKTFEKAGEKGWKAFVPVYNFLVWLRIIKKPWWWIFLVMIPTVGFYMLAIMIVLLSNCFGKRKFTDHVFAVLGYFIWMPYLGFSKEIKFQGVPPEEKKKHWGKEWGEAGIFAIVAATLIRTFFFEAFVIPSSSMESTLMVGDYLFVSKMSYGAKVPAIPLTIPFTHNTMPLTECTPSYLDWIELPYWRLPGFGSVERNDIVVFNFPEGDTVHTSNRNGSYYGDLRRLAKDKAISTDEARAILVPDSIIVNPIDKEDNYVKRCVAVAGDVLEVRDRVLLINSGEGVVPKNAQWAWDFNAKFQTNDDYNSMMKQFQNAGIVSNPQEGIANSIYDSAYQFSIPVNANKLDVFKSIVGNARISLTPKGMIDFDCFPHDPIHFPWNRDNYGPLKIPKKGTTVKLTLDSLALWERIIRVYEGNSMEIKNGVIYINGKIATTYTFQQDYYWMMGDNRHNSLDSRYWGFVPADHIVGKPVFVWMSKGDYSGYRPDRMMSFVSKDGLSKSHLVVVLIGLVIVFSIGPVRRKLKEKNKKPEINTKK